MYDWGSQDGWVAEDHTAEWVDWINNQRLHTAFGDIPPHKHETNHCAQHQPQPAAGVNA